MVSKSVRILQFHFEIAYPTILFAGKYYFETGCQNNKALSSSPHLICFETIYLKNELVAVSMTAILLIGFLMAKKINERTNEWKNERINDWTNERMNEWTNARTNEWMNEWMIIYIYIYIYIYYIIYIIYIYTNT